MTHLDRHLHVHHRNLTTGAARAAMFGISDGLVSNLALICAFAGAGAAAHAVLLAGIAGLFAGAGSMAAGEYVSMRAQQELIDAELAKEAAEIARNPHGEHLELANLLRARGVHPDAADEVAAALMITPEVALETHAREELGVDPNNTGSPIGAAGASFVAFAAGAAAPLLPWLVASGARAAAASIVVGVAVSIAVGATLARLGAQARRRPIIRQLSAMVLAVVLTTTLGWLVGT